MTDLSGSFLDKKIGDIAQYFSASARDVANALDFGARTYQDVHDYLERIKLEEKAPKPTAKEEGRAPMEPVTHISDLLNDLTASDIIELNKYHDHPSKNERYQKIRDKCNDLMVSIMDNCPPCADRIAAINAVRQARMWANSAIALDKIG